MTDKIEKIKINTLSTTHSTVIALQVYNYRTLQCPVVIGKEIFYDNEHKYTRARKRKNHRFVLSSVPRR